MQCRIIGATALAGLFVAGLTLAGCQSGIQNYHNLDRTYPVDTTISLSPSTTEVVCIADYCGNLKGRTSSDDFPGQVSKIKIVVDGTTPNYEEIAKLKPNFIVYDSTLYGPDVVDKLKGLGAKLLPYNPKTVDDYLNFIKEYAYERGGETNASEYIDKVENAIGASKGMVEACGHPVSTAFVEPGPTLLAAGTKSFWYDLMKQSGITLLGPDSDKCADWNVEDLVKQNPQTIVTTEGGKAGIYGDPRFASVDAVKNKMVFEVKSGVLLRVGSRVDALLTAIVPRLTKSDSDQAVGAPLDPSATPAASSGGATTGSTPNADATPATAGAGK